VSKSTILATGRISAADIITITYVEPGDSPPAIFVRWPGQPSITDRHRLPSLANQVMAIMAAAIARLAMMEGDY
jgi:hypothetical protein